MKSRMRLIVQTNWSSSQQNREEAECEDLTMFYHNVKVEEKTRESVRCRRKEESCLVLGKKKKVEASSAQRGSYPVL